MATNLSPHLKTGETSKCLRNYCTMNYSRHTCENLGSHAHAALGLLRSSSYHHGIGGTPRSCGQASLHMHQDIWPPLASVQHG